MNIQIPERKKSVPTLQDMTHNDTLCQKSIITSHIAVFRWQRFHSLHEHWTSDFHYLEAPGVGPGAHIRPHMLAWGMGCDYNDFTAPALPGPAEIFDLPQVSPELSKLQKSQPTGRHFLGS